MLFNDLLIYLNDKGYRYRVEPRIGGEDYFVRVIKDNGDYIRISPEGSVNYIRDGGAWCGYMRDKTLMHRLEEFHNA